MKTMSVLSAFGLSLSLLTATPRAMADESIEMPKVERDQAVAQVKGVVCSFCAFGTEKALSKLSFLDQSQFGGDGVLMDIHANRITLALQRGEKLDLTQVYDAIKKGGYDLTTVYVNLHGQVHKSGDRYLLTSPDNAQVFEISGNNVEELVGKGLIQVKGQVDAERILGIKAGQPIPVIVSSSGTGL